MWVIYTGHMKEILIVTAKVLIQEDVGNVRFPGFGAAHIKWFGGRLWADRDCGALGQGGPFDATDCSRSLLYIYISVSSLSGAPNGLLQDHSTVDRFYCFFFQNEIYIYSRVDI